MKNSVGIVLSILALVCSSFALAIAYASLSRGSANADIERIMGRSRRNTAAFQHRQTQRELELVYAELARGFLQRDLSIILAMRTGDYSIQLTDGSVLENPQVQKHFESVWNQVEETSRMDYSILSLTVNYDEASAVVQQTWHRKQRNGEKVQNVETEVIQRDIWIKSQDQWKLKHTADLDDKSIIVDGQQLKKPPRRFNNSPAKWP